MKYAYKKYHRTEAIIKRQSNNFDHLVKPIVLLVILVNLDELI